MQNYLEYSQIYHLYHTCFFELYGLSSHAGLEMMLTYIIASDSESLQHNMFLNEYPHLHIYTHKCITVRKDIKAHPDSDWVNILTFCCLLRHAVCFGAFLSLFKNYNDWTQQFVFLWVF